MISVVKHIVHTIDKQISEVSMDKLKPKLCSVLKHYTAKQFFQDAKAGFIVAIIALPLSIAFALGCGISAEKGIWCAIIASITVALLGGSRVQITGPTGAFIVITQSTLLSFGSDGLKIAMILAGILLILMGSLKLGKLIQYIPTPITVGFTAGIAVTIFTLETKDFLGLQIESMPRDFLGKWSTYITHLQDINVDSVLLGLFCIAILIVWPKLNKTIPNSFLAIVIGTVLSRLLHLKVTTLGSIPKGLTIRPLPSLEPQYIMKLLPSAFTIALLVAMQALLSAVVTDELIQSKHRSNMELIAQGIANIFLGVLGCIPATGGVARSISNAKNGARTPIAAIVHGITLLLFIALCMPWIRYIPLSVLAAILIVVSINMFNPKVFFSYLHAPKSDLIVLLTSCIFTFAVDLVFAIEVGFILSCLLFMKRMKDVTELEEIHRQDIAEDTLIFHYNGPMFFAAVNKLDVITKQITDQTKVVILEMMNVPTMDATALQTLRTIKHKLNEQHKVLLLSDIHQQPMSVMKQTHFTDEFDQHNLCSNLDVALCRAQQLSQSL